LYVPRPWVEPELFASLRPPVYAGNMDDAEQPRRAEAPPGVPPADKKAGGKGGKGGFGGKGKGKVGESREGLDELSKRIESDRDAKQRARQMTHHPL
jgi:hypothetical protein